MNRSKIIFAAVSVVFVVLVAVAGFVANGKRAAAEKAKKGRDREFKELEAVFQDDIFPSATNVTALQTNVRDLEDTRADMESALAAMNVPSPTNISASVFMRTLQDLILKKVKTAPVVEGKKCVASEFAFGFDRYVGSSSRMPRENEVPRLVQQLLIVSAVVDEMYASGVSQILAIRRERFEAGAGGDEAQAEGRQGGRGRSRRREAQSDSNEDAPSGSSVPSIQTDLYSAQHFSIHCVARQGAVVDLLNRLARLRYFTVVTDVRLRKVGPDVRIPGLAADKPQESAPRRGRRTEGVVVETEDGGPVLSDLPPSQRLMSGPDIDPPLDVMIDMYVYRFEKEAK